MTGSDDLSGLLAPASVAIIGASNRDGNLGGAAAGHLGRYGYKGSVWPVHPSEQSVAGFACYPDLASLPGVPDVAILAIPAAGLVDAVEQCGFFGIRNAIAWAGGFAEAGEEGRGQQALLTDACMRYGIRLCGPNCLGIVNSATGFTGTFSSSLLDMEELTKGSIAMVSQSGGIATVTNFGTFGLTTGTPIPLPNETLILGIGAGVKKPVWSVQVEAFLPATEADLLLTFDHRVVDGGGAGVLLNRVSALLQKPEDL